MTANEIVVPAVDLYSDTVSRPTDGMRRAMAEAEVGNEQAMEDPTVNRLCDRVAELLGKEAAVFLPSGTMCNEIAYRVWVDRGEEIILEETAHALHFEAGGPAALAGAMCRTLKGERGIFSAADLETVIRTRGGKHGQRQALVNLENTANLGGGAVWPLAAVAEVAECARSHNLKVHMDGARLLNAVVASGTLASAYGQLCDSVWIDLSKGLGCPVGGVLAGSAEFIDRAWLFKHQFGGAMRQAGILAAAGLYALDHHVQRLSEDHANARYLAEGIAAIGGLSVAVDEIETNMVYFDVETGRLDAAGLSARLMQDHKVRIGAMGPRRMRAVTHIDIDRSGIEAALGALKSAMETA
ncbi:beta-eliminating lyase-related protein [Nisaea acidiphila]|uniref:Beta-eliminating lyase-related protein n=1 Tax=Nisaea acidiphila TaxID=1862145 RepID=A0A9J7AWX0_9PROT|nr:GntG family PLP-dependent aldolase [Nisaea acidiphila]UUX50748.1 beta-eliminating lyase-related protein [Nisaea acidiphila]